MLEQIKLKSTQAAATAQAKAELLKNTAQKSTDIIQAKAKLAADSIHITIPAVIGGKNASISQSKSTNPSSKVREARPPSNHADQEDEGLLDEISQQCQLNLTKRQRLYGAAICFALGALFGFLSTLMMWSGPRHIKQFAFFYTLSNCLGIGSSLFIIGIKRQFKVMCMPIRRIACCTWISAMLLTLIIVIGFPKAGPLVLLLIIVQYGAMLWYGASFVPYGRALLKKCFQKVTDQVNVV